LSDKTSDLQCILISLASISMMYQHRYRFALANKFGLSIGKN
jgi:hypothetical protein